MGYALVGLAAGGPGGVRGTIIYMAIYMIMTIGTFACVIAMRYKEGAVEEIGDLAGLARTNKLWPSSWRCSCFRSPEYRLLPGSSPNISFSSPPSKEGW